MKRQAVLFLALLCHAVPVIPQDMRLPVQVAQPAQAPEPPPQPKQPPQKPTTATPTEDTGMAGQVARGSVVLPAAGAVSTSAILMGILGVAAAAALMAGSSSDDNAAAPATTGTR